jgi:hypothetical protein
MRKTFKKAIAVILTVLMVVCSLPFTALAAVGDYEPDIQLQFGTFHANKATTYAADPNSPVWTSKAAAGALSAYGQTGITDAPLEYNYKVKDGVVSGSLVLTKEKADLSLAKYKYNATQALSEDYTYGVGDYFTVTVKLANLEALQTYMSAIQYSDNIEPAGAFSYTDGDYETQTVLGTVSEFNEIAASQADWGVDEDATWIIGGTTPIYSQSCRGIYQAKTSGFLDQNWTSYVDTDNNFIYSQLGSGGVIDLTAEIAKKTTYSDPETGEFNSYSYDNTCILDTIVFKIVGEGDISFSLYDTDNTKLGGFQGGYCIVDFLEDGATCDKYTTYAINTYIDGNHPSGGDVNPGSTKMSFMGTNVNWPTEDCDHSDYTVVNANPATCTEDGYSGDKVCNNCGETIEQGEAIPATGHSYTGALTPNGDKQHDVACVNGCGTVDTVDCTFTSTVTTPATEKTEGVMTWTCKCGNSYTTVIEKVACDHSGATHVENAKTATCTEAGYTGDTICDVCDNVIATGTAIKATGHDFTGALTPNGDKQHDVACANDCGTVDTVDCTFTSTVTTPATEKTEGVMTWTCACGNSYTTVIEKVDCAHSATHVENAKTATCTEAGYTGDTICDVCGNTIATGVAIDALGHEYTGAYVNNGDKTHSQKCVRYDDCGSVSTPVECTNLSSEVTTPATCESAGVTTYTCNDCGYVFTDDTTPVATGHNYTGAITDNGNKTHDIACVNGCGTAKTVDCNYTEEITTPASYTNTGLKTFTCTDCGNTYTQVIDKLVCQHDGTSHVENDKEASFDAAGYTGDTVCDICNQVIATGATIPAIEGYTVTVDATDLGTVTLNDDDVTNGAAKKIAKGDQITLTAKAVDGAEFLGWTVNGKTTISTDETITATVLANITYTPVFEIATDDQFTVTFVDAFANIVSVQKVSAGSEVQVPDAPIRVGYSAATENGWSLTNDEISALTDGATITAQYTKDEETLYTVTATGCELTANGETANDTVSVPYGTKVTVSNENAEGWSVNGVAVGYGSSYSFFVTADIELATVANVVKATPKVANVGIGETTTASGLVKAVFKATRTMADGYQYVDSGFVYGKGDLGEITLGDVTGSTVKAVYNKTDSEQFNLSYGLSAQSGTMTARAFIAYVDLATGTTETFYADPMTYTYR